MFKKKLTTLLYEEEKELIRNNPELLEKLRDTWLDNAAFWVSEYLTNCAGCDYSINNGYSYGSGNYFRITDISRACDWLSDLQKTYGFLSEDNYKSVEALAAEYLSVDFDHEITEALKIKVEALVLTRIESEFNYWFTDENIITEGLEAYIINNPNSENLYTDLKRVFEYTPPEVVPGRFIPAHYEQGYTIPGEINIII